jgi:hypothetical protein
MFDKILIFISLSTYCAIVACVMFFISKVKSFGSFTEETPKEYNYKESRHNLVQEEFSDDELEKTLKIVQEFHPKMFGLEDKSFNVNYYQISVKRSF